MIHTKIIKFKKEIDKPTSEQRSKGSFSIEHPQEDMVKVSWLQSDTML
jgi:hypothetical protein